MEYSVEEIQNAYKKSSSKIRQVLDDAWIAEDTAKIGKEVDLRIDKVDILIKIIGLTLLNLISISDFIKVLEKELSVGEDYASKIAQRVDESVFQKVRDMVKEKEEQDFKVETEKENTREEVTKLMDDIEEDASNVLSFKDKFNKVVEKKIEKKIVDPYREPIE